MLIQLPISLKKKPNGVHLTKKRKKNIIERKKGRDFSNENKVQDESTVENMNASPYKTGGL